MPWSFHSRKALCQIEWTTINVMGSTEALSELAWMELHAGSAKSIGFYSLPMLLRVFELPNYYDYRALQLT